MIAFTDVREGDRLSFLTSNNGYDGTGRPVKRIGTVTRVTTKTVAVDCGDNPWGKRAVLRRSAWSSRCPVRLQAAPRNWRTATTPVTLDEVTDAMLTDIRAAADGSWLPQTVWPSRWYGNDFAGSPALLAGSAMGSRVPGDAAPGTEPLFTVLPSDYLSRTARYLQAVTEGHRPL